jgi:peptidoglycan/xylan/chitin deacetylase (PgdA/CDA1 family)
MSKRNKIIIWFIVFCSAVWSNSIMTIIDDDSSSLQAIDTVKRIADSHKVKVTFGVIAKRLEDDPAIAARLMTFQEEGHEIASHSYSHSPSIWSRREYSDGLLVKMEEDLVNADHILRENGFHLSSFVYPYGKFYGKEYRGKIIDMVQKHYPVAFNARGGFNHSNNTCFGYVGRLPMRSHNNLSMIKLQMRHAMRKGDCWFVVLTHSGMANFSPSDLEEIIEYGRTKGFTFMTATEALQYWQKTGWQSMSVDQLKDFSLFDEGWDFLYLHFFTFLFAFIVLVFLVVIAIILIKKRLKNAQKK